MSARRSAAFSSRTPASVDQFRCTHWIPEPSGSTVWGERLRQARACGRLQAMNFARDVVDAAPAGSRALVELARDGARREYTFGEVADRAPGWRGTSPASASVVATS